MGGDQARPAFFLALTKIFRPLVRIALRNGVSFRACSDVLKWCFVDVAFKEFPPQGKSNSKSRVAIITGITRVEVDRMLKKPHPRNSAAQEQYHRASKVLTGWSSDPKYQDSMQQPLALKFDDGELSFNTLVYDHSGGTPARPMLDELLASGSVSESADGDLHLIRSFFIPHDDENTEQNLNILGVSAGDLLNTIESNIRPGQGRPYFQRVILSRKLPAGALDEIRLRARADGQDLADRFDEYLFSKQNSESGDQASSRAGIGIYYFETPETDSGESGDDVSEDGNNESK